MELFASDRLTPKQHPRIYGGDTLRKIWYQKLGQVSWTWFKQSSSLALSFLLAQVSYIEWNTAVFGNKRLHTGASDNRW